MAKIFTFSIVCLSFFSVGAQPASAPFAAAESERRKEIFDHFNASIDLHRWEIYEDTIDAWKRWDVVDNYSFGPNRGNMTMINDLQSLHPYFRDQVLELMRLCKLKGIELAIVETYRTPTKQNEYKSMGRRYTRAGAGQSKHQYGLAVDLVPMVNGRPVWGNSALWRKVGVAGERLGLQWGGRWRRLYDPGHFEWTGGVGINSLAQGEFPAVPANATYPCLEADLKELQRHWKSWQLLQSEVARKEAATRLSAKSMPKPLSREGGDD